MKKVYHIIFIGTIIGTILASGMKAQVQEVEIEAAMDNSIFEEGDLSGGGIAYLYSGVNNKDFIRRALIKFDVNSVVPEGATVDSAMLVLVPSKVNLEETGVNLHKVLVAWGEGTTLGDGRGEGQGGSASEGDATWSHAMFGGDAWIKEGGDYMAKSSASASVTDGNDAVFKSSGLTDDINAWLSIPEDNHGWIVLGDESGTKTTIRFISRESPEEEFRPTLKLFYSEGPTSSFNAEAGRDEIRVYQGHGLGELLVEARSSIGKSRFELYSVSGALVYSGDIDLRHGQARVMSSLEKPGLYIYRVSSAGSIESGKILVRGQ
jgi:hypothetical protein